MKSIITLLILNCTSFIFGQTRLDLNFKVETPNHEAIPYAEVLFYTENTNTLLHYGVADSKGIMVWKNAPKTNMKVVFEDTNYVYRQLITYLFEEDLTSEPIKIEIEKFSNKQRNALALATQDPQLPDSVLFDVSRCKGESAQYPGGREAMVAFLQKTVHVPVSAEETGVNGKVYLRFVILADGSIRHLTVEKSLTPDTDLEAMIAISLMPKWTPATCNGVAVPSYFVLPIVFNVQ